MVHGLLSLVLDGSLKVGDRLPGERDLAARLGVGRSALREAMSALEVLGVIESRVGSGNYLRSTTSELLPRTLSWSLLLNRQQTAHLSAVRSLLERGAAEQAAAQATDADVSRLRETVGRQRAAMGDTEQFIAADLAFHQVLADVAGNQVLADLLSTIRSLLHVWSERAVADPVDIRSAVEEHAAICEAIEARDPARAVAAMDRHMATASGRISRALDVAREEDVQRA